MSKTNERGGAKMSNTKIVELVQQRAEAAETQHRLLGSSDGVRGLAVFDAALARLDLELARLAEIKRSGMLDLSKEEEEDSV